MPQFNGVSIRHELKYIINETDYLWLRDRLFSALPLDQNANPNTRIYHIRSLYFDDMQNSAMWDKQDGLIYRRKFRMRLYNLSDRKIQLERKEKMDRYTAKTAAPLTRRQCLEIIHGNYTCLSPNPNPLFQDFYARIRHDLLRPRVIVDYEREAYTYPAGNVRITFDRDLHSGQFSQNLFVPMVSPIPVLEPGTLIMEVKFDDVLPPQIRAMLQGVAGLRTAYSKYAMCRRFH